MKKLFITICVTLASIGAFAQKGEHNIGAQILYGTDASNIGFGLKYQYNITDAIRLEAVGDYYLKTDGFSMYDININGQYLFHLSDKFTIYPFVGINYTHWEQDMFADSDIDEWFEEETGEKMEASFKDSSIGFNIGGGVQYNLTSKLRIGAEIKYQTVSGANTAVISAGITYAL